MLCVLLATPAAFATSATWSGGTSALWSDTNNWVGVPASVPTTNQTATFNAASANSTIDLTGGVTVGSSVFDTASAAAYTIGAGGAGAQTLTWGNTGNILVNSTVVNNQIFDANLSLGTAAGTKSFIITNNSVTAGLTLNGGITTAQTGTSTIFFDGAGTTTINGPIDNGTGTIALEMRTNSPGMLVLNGTNTHTGNTIVRDGTLIIKNNSAINGSRIAFPQVGTSPTAIFATDGGDINANLGSSSGATFTLVSDVKTGSVGTNYTLTGGSLNVASGTSASSGLIMNITRGANVLSGDPRITLPAVTLAGGSGGYTLLNPTTANLTIGDITTTASSFKRLMLGGTSTDNRVTGNITDSGSFRIAFVKTNAGTWTLSGANSCPGSITVAEGTLIMNGFASTASTNISVASGATLTMSDSASAASAKISVDSGATLDVSGLTAGALILNVNQTLAGSGLVQGSVDCGSGTVAPGTATAGTLTVSNLTLSGSGYLHFDVANVTAVGGGTNDYLVVPGTLTVVDFINMTLNLGLLNGYTASSGKYTLISYGAYSGPADISTVFTVPSGYTITNNASAKTIELVPPPHTPISLKWVGNLGSTWDTITTNWNSPDNLFYNGDSPRFDDTATTTGTLTVSEPVICNTINVSNSAPYSFTSSSVTAANLVKEGSGTLTLENDVTVSSGTVISAGTLQVGNMSTGSLTTSGITNNAALVFSQSGYQIVGAVISGAGSVLVNNAIGGITGLGSNSYSGLTTISSGALRINDDSSLGSTAAGTVVEGNGQLYAASSRTIDEPLTLNPIDTSVDAVAVGGNSTFVINTPVAVNGNSAVRADGGSSLVFSNILSGVGSFETKGNGTTVLASSNSFSGGLSVSAGTLMLADDNAMGGNSQIVVSSLTGGAGLSGTRVTLAGGVTIPSGKSVNLPTLFSGAIRSTLFGTGIGLTNTWAGPITIQGDDTSNCQVQIGVDSGSTLILSGAITAQQFTNSILAMRGSSGGLGIISGQVTLATDSRFNVLDGTTWVISSTGNTWGRCNIAAGTLRLGADNALPTTSAMFNGSANSTFDLAGYNQTLAGLGALLQITNSSAVSDSTLTYASAETNTLTGSVRDGVRKLNLTVSSGTLELTSAATLNIPSSTLSVGAAGVLNLNYTGTNTVASLMTNGIAADPGFYSSANSAPYLDGTGVIEVAVPGPSSPATLTNSYNASLSQLTLSWPDEGWKLQEQTNSLAIGLATNWVYVTDGTVSTTNITVDPLKPTVFYRLVYP